MLMLRILMALLDFKRKNNHQSVSIGFSSTAKTILFARRCFCFRGFEMNANTFQLPLFIAVVLFSAAIIDVYLASDWPNHPNVERLMEGKKGPVNHNGLLYQHLTQRSAFYTD